MRVLLMTNEFPPNIYGGAGVHVEHLAAELARRIESGSGFDDIARLAGWDGIYLTSLHCPEDHPFVGKSLAQIAALTGQDPLDCCCDLLVREDGQITMIDFMAHEEDIAAILQDPFSNLISDSTYPTEGQPHPRVYGTFVHLLTRFVLQRGDLTPEAAIHKMTGRPAAVLGMPDRGVLAPGAQADINIFAPEDLREPGTYQDPCRMAEGMDTVLVAGGEITLPVAGTVLAGQPWNAAAHGPVPAGSAGKEDLPVQNYQIPLFIYAPKLIEPRETAQLASQIDLAPTLMGLLNLDYVSTFFGRNLLQDNPLPPRVVVGNYQHLGLFDGKDLAILSPRQGLRRHDDALSTSIESRVAATDPLIERAIAYYQGASYAFRNRLLSWH